MKVSLFKKPEKLTVSQFAEKNVIMQEGAFKGQRFSYKTRPYFRDPSDAMGDNTKNCRVVIVSPTQLGKDLNENELLPTPYGFKKMKDLSVGDTIFSASGQETKIVFKTPLHSRPFYKIVFDDGTSIECGDNHRWYVKDTKQSYNKKHDVFRTLETKDMFLQMKDNPFVLTRLYKGKKIPSLRSQFAIPQCSPVQYPERELPIDPYLLGFWLGDGLSRSSYVCGNKEKITNIFDKYTVEYSRKEKGSECYRVRVSELTTKLLRINGLLNNKHIPEIYKIASYEQRLALIQGIMDADGCCSKDGQCEITLKNDNIFNGVVEILRSFGIKVHTTKKLRKIRSEQYNYENTYNFCIFRTTIPVFTLKSKLERLPESLPREDTKYRYIREIIDLHKEVNGYCIQVDDPSHLYLCTRDYFVTHNTTAFLNYLFYICEYDPDNTLVILDSQKTADKLMKVRIRPFLQNQVKLESLQKGLQLDYNKSASTSNISLAAGKSILAGSARSASDLCSFTCKYLLCDEVSRFPEFLDKEGDPVSLAMQRQETFARSMAILTSTPTTEDCTIWQHYKLGTQRRWSAVCECGYHMPVYYKDIDFSDINNPTYTCPKCGIVYDEYTLQYKLKHEYAPPANNTPFKDSLGRVCESYHIPGTLVPERYTWKYLKEKEISARQLGLSAYQSFVNTSLGEVYYPGVDESIDVNRMLSCRKYFTKDSIPSWVKFITCGIDTQDDRFELLILGSDNARKHICFIERKIIVGDLRQSIVWQELLQYLNDFTCTTRDKRQLPIHITCIDSGGHFTQDVYAFCLRSPRLRPVKGIGLSASGADLIYKVSDVPVKAYANGANKIKLTLVNTNYAKDIIHAQLLKIQADNKISDWIISSHIDANFDSIFFDQMNSEFRETLKGGQFRWTCKHGSRNESLDCSVYALCAVDIARLMTGNAAPDLDTEDFKQEKFLEPPSNDEPLSLDQILKEERELNKQNNDNNTTINNTNNNTINKHINMRRKRRL